MKNSKKALFGILGALLVLSIAVYAHGDERVTEEWQYSWNHFDLNEMDEMHDALTKNLDSELKEEMDDMHEECIWGWFMKNRE